MHGMTCLESSQTFPSERISRARSALEGTRVAILGAGRIAGVLIERLLVTQVVDPAQITVSDIDPETRSRLAEKWKITEAAGNRNAVAAGDLVVVAVPPPMVLPVLAETASTWRDDHMLISLAAMVPTTAIEAALGRTLPIIRVIPNVPSLVGSGMNPYCLGDHVDKPQVRLAECFLELLGDSVRVDEEQMAAATALTGMGPTYVFPLLRALAEAGHDSGLDEATALRCATQMVLGTAAMVMETGRHPDDLRQLVPATTVDEEAVREMFGGTVRRICQGLREKESLMTAREPAEPVLRGKGT